MIEQLERVAQRPVSRETFERLQAFVDLLREENARQNLVSAATLGRVWDRHILDSAQLIGHAPAGPASWIDIGSGAGLPGIVIACLVDGPVTLVDVCRRSPKRMSQATPPACGASSAPRRPPPATDKRRRTLSSAR